ncbi:MAG: Abi family protein [Fusobacteriaceae bacterium]|nr:Abi family protein [Fusobacteriaceae bacterium]
MARNKTHLSYEDQLKLFESRGMIVNDEAHALERLRQISYYKIKEFSLFFMNAEGRYNPGTSFEAVIQNFYYDKNLRMEFLSMAEKIELSMKNKFAYLMGKKYGSFGYLNFNKWCDRTIPKPQIDREQGAFALKLKVKIAANANAQPIADYKRDFPDNKDLPLWIATEILTFGEIIHLYKLMAPKNRISIARQYNLKATEFASFVDHIKFIRNLCAHNRPVINLTIKSVPVIPKSFLPYLCEENKIAVSVMIFVYFVKIIRPEYDFAQLKRALSKLIKRNAVAKKYGFASKKAIDSFIKSKEEAGGTANL